MNVTNPLGSDEIEKSSEVEGGRNARGLALDQIDRKVSAEDLDLAATFRRLSDAPIREIDQLVNQLQRLRAQLKNRSNRIQGEIAEYAELSQQTMQLTSIIVDSVRKLPPGAPQ